MGLLGFGLGLFLFVIDFACCFDLPVWVWLFSTCVLVLGLVLRVLGV